MHEDEAKVEEPSSTANAHPSRRSFRPRFGLRTALIVAVVFCLLTGWIGRNFAKMRREDAALEALKRVQGSILLQGDDFRARHPATPAPPAAARVWGGGPPVEMEEDWYGRLFGWADRLPIRHVNLHASYPDDENLSTALAALAVFPEIESVNLHGPGFDDSSLPPLTKIASLEAVGLFGVDVSAEGLKTLAPARELRRLSLFGRSIDAAPGFSTLTQLRVVTVSGDPGERVTGMQESVEAIAGLPHLEELTLAYLQQRDPELFQPISRCAKLRSLTVMSIAVSGADVAAIANLPALESLRINNLDDAELAMLGPLPTLKKIELDAPVTVEAAREFSKSHPDCRVEYAAYRPDGIIFQAGEVIEATGDRSSP